MRAAAVSPSPGGHSSQALRNVAPGTSIPGSKRGGDDAHHDADAPQAVAEMLLAARLVEPGVYAVMQDRVLRLPGVVVNRESLCFERA